MDDKKPVVVVDDVKPPKPYASLLNTGALGHGKGIVEMLAHMVLAMPRGIDPIMRSTVPQYGMSDKVYRLRKSRRRMAALSRWHNRGRKGHTALHHVM